MLRVRLIHVAKDGCYLFDYHQTVVRKVSIKTALAFVFARGVEFSHRSIVDRSAAFYRLNEKSLT